ncbi:selenide, water dikinase SelD [Planctomycetes bacterium K23_9]|uniref:Selenide, water dikinase n=1 Tax=Stieleria marina TaxID=1930275 RepID=A0A517NSE2_9BACT|nr:Selenide, water dikinase [Planctomycetes bacterium K23_9]
MNQSSDRDRSCSKHIVLVGVGHTNAHIVRMWGMDPIPDTDLTCISDFPIATYSGMMPAVLARQVPPDQMQIDLVRLCESVGARLILGNVRGVDHHKREVLMDDHPPIAFDALSIGIGSVPTTNHVDIASDSLIKIKPMQTFMQRLADQVRRVEKDATQDNLKIAIVGSGVAGVEISLCLPNFLKEHSERRFDLRIVTRSKQVLPSVSDSMRKKALAKIQQRGIEVTTGQTVVGVTPQGIQLDNGSLLHADIVIWATGASAPDALERFALPTDDRGFLLTDATLRSTSGKPCFAVGDTGTIVSQNLPKAGVYAVRQGPVLWQNLRRLLRGQDLTTYRPQRSFLKLLNCGDSTAIGQWKFLSFSGRWVMGLKHRIDSNFMEMYRPMEMGSSDDPDSEMQCRGCGCKLGADPLAKAIAMIGGDKIPLEDAAVVHQDSESTLLASTDFFTTPFDDAYLSGRVAALHSASDIIASGGVPTHALANVVLSEGDETTQQRTLADFLAGARRQFDEVGANIVGGHTIVGPRMEAGFTVIGRTDGNMLRKSNLQSGDVLCLTKPLGIGVLLAAHMRSLCSASEYLGVIESMLAPQHGYIPFAKSHETTAMTDVTGFGLAGHLIEMLRESGAAAELSLQQVPLLDGTERLLNAGVQSTLAPDNRRFERWVDAHEELRELASYRALFDPQTCGGLLFGIDPNRLDQMNSELIAAGLPPAVRVATVISSDKPMLKIVA